VGLNDIHVKLHIDTSELDTAIEKAERLRELLQETHATVPTGLSSNGIKISPQDWMTAKQDPA